MFPSHPRSFVIVCTRKLRAVESAAELDSARAVCRLINKSGERVLRAMHISRWHQQLIALILFCPHVTAGRALREIERGIGSTICAALMKCVRERFLISAEQREIQFMALSAAFKNTLISASMTHALETDLILSLSYKKKQMFLIRFMKIFIF